MIIGTVKVTVYYPRSRRQQIDVIRESDRVRPVRGSLVVRMKAVS
jgi:hypothetical protein